MYVQPCLCSARDRCSRKHSLLTFQCLELVSCRDFANLSLKMWQYVRTNPAQNLNFKTVAPYDVARVTDGLLLSATDAPPGELWACHNESRPRFRTTPLVVRVSLSQCAFPSFSFFASKVWRVVPAAACKSLALACKLDDVNISDWSYYQLLLF